MVGESALREIYAYLRSNKSQFNPDDEFSRISGCSQPITIYFYEPEELRAVLRADSIAEDQLGELGILLDKSKSGCFATGNRFIMINKRVPERFIACEVMHELAHMKFSHEPAELQEARARQICHNYALAMGFLWEYLETMKRIFGSG
ncbi:hypothetical protein COT48_04220 [Candidatus Woesearchaeota archaeon CG08_land_8_20_14_0_20_47_9]|nr:MAG: hypothetical protein AUJ69_01745 [Candidatus Woesearchaeota archaeon CG1_02_47_18]PIO03595.1 MAG: hypothetical protein COT48_04220 [Candidatus Woesearchaeota archaeon CG08_land_8_20_14_0_20_47_9]HII30387.1 hypothetical protein [Candidatus Woesearchaeota archaeon]